MLKSVELQRTTLLLLSLLDICCYRAGPQFTEELWHILCKGIKQIIDSTLANVKELIVCFHDGSNSVNGDNGMVVKIVARRDVTPTENMRLMQIAEQVRYYLARCHVVSINNK